MDQGDIKSEAVNQNIDTMNHAFHSSRIFKKVFLLGSILFVCYSLAAQQTNALTLEQCYTLARQNYPQIRQKDLIRKSRDYSIENASKGYLPQLNVAGQLTYQSEVIAVTNSIPGIEVPTFSKTQYKIYGELDQVVYDGGNIKIHKETEGANADVQDQNIEVQLYAIKDRINQLYFGILLINAQIHQNELQQEDLKDVVKSVQTAVDNGAAFRRSLDESKVELLKVEQNHIDLQSTRKNYLSVLGLFINRTIDESTEFETPPKWLLTTNINRPELKVYDFQKRIYDLQERQLSSDLQPKLSAFIQGGYSLPSLNFLSINPNFYYIGGLKLNWSLGSLYTHKNDKRILADNRKAQDIEQETFVFNTNQTLQKESDEVSRMIQMIEKDNDIIALRSSIKNAAKTQAQNGVITVHDYLTYVNDENRARQDLILHEVQLLFSQYNHKTASGN